MAVPALLRTMGGVHSRTPEPIMRTASPTIPSTLFQSAITRLVERASATPAGERSHLLGWLLAAGALFLVWRAWRGFKSLFWTVFGLGMALYWSGTWHAWF